MSQVPFDIWQTGDMTEHLGGVSATCRLLEFCRPLPGQRVLDIGCATGYTACTLARTYGAWVVALDGLAANLARTRRRTLKAGVTRELGILAVVGCGNATMLLQTGDRVRVDGERGVVELM
jgi:cyclopropane fatty-acyl-phospholipid synthase-like methyltransferase